MDALVMLSEYEPLVSDEECQVPSPERQVLEEISLWLAERAEQAQD